MRHGDAPHRLPLVAVRLRAGLHVLRDGPHGARPQPRRPRRSASSCCASRACCATSRTRASRNVVMMGMGEPFHNYDNVLAAIRTINAPGGLRPGRAPDRDLDRRLDPRASTSWPRSRCRSSSRSRCTRADDELRSKLMPVTKRYPIAALMEACRRYRERTRRRVFIEYLLLAGVNDERPAGAAARRRCCGAAARAPSTST